MSSRFDPQFILVLALIALLSVQPLYAARGTDQSVHRTLSTIENTFNRAVKAVEQGDRPKAKNLSTAAFMTFEESSLHNSLSTQDPSLYGRLEQKYLEFRSAITEGADGTVLQQKLQSITSLHGTVRETLNADRMSVWAAGISSFMIIFREGLEALLVIAAMTAYLYKINEEERTGALFWGTGLALLVSLLLAGATNYLFNLSGAGRELLEGLTLLLATGVLFYVSFWLISKIEKKKWKQFIESKIDRSVEAGSSLMLATVGFLVVFREGFETVLFYQALGFSAGRSFLGGVGIVSGFLVGALALVFAGYFVIKGSQRIPLRPFFVVTSGFLYFLAFKFAGDGIYELQEAGVLSMESVHFVPDVTWLKTFFGIYPMWKPVVVQLLLILLLTGGLIYTFRNQFGRLLRPTPVSKK